MIPAPTGGIDFPGIAAVITALGPTIAIIAGVWIQLRQVKKTGDKLIANQEAIHELVNGTSKEQVRQVTALKTEIARVSRTIDGATPTQFAGSGGSPVGIDHGVVTVENVGNLNRSTDEPPLPHKTEGTGGV